MRKILGVFFLFFLFFIAFLLIFKITGFMIGQTNSVISIDEGIRVIYNKFDGSTTDFLRKTDANLQELENMTLEVSNEGKIVFLEDVNLTEDVVNNSLDLDERVSILHNLVQVDLDNLSSMNKPALIYLYNLNLRNPRILKNGNVCSDCEILTNNNSVLIFKVPSPTHYSADESPVIVPEESERESSGGDSVRTIPTIKDVKPKLNIKPSLISIALYQNESKELKFEIENTGEIDLNLSLKFEYLEGIGYLSTNNVFVVPGETKNLVLTFNGTGESGVRIGSLTIEGMGIKEIVSVFVNIKTPDLIDLVINFPKNKKYYSNDELDFNVLLEKFSEGSIDASAIIQIFDLNRNLIYESSWEKVVLDKDNIEIEKSVKIDNFNSGKYVLIYKVKYKDITKETFEIFDVMEKEDSDIMYLSIAVIIISVAVLILLIILFMNMRALKKMMKVNRRKNGKRKVK